MKKLLSLVFATLFALAMNAQGHLMFKGVAIDGTTSDFVKGLENQGFTKIRVQNETAILSGKFAGKMATILTYVSPKSKNVYKVNVLYEAGSQWSSIEPLYNEMKGMLTQKYGAPTSVVEGDASSNYMHDLQRNQLTWKSAWSVDKGTVYVQIAHDETIGNVVIVGYEDKANSEEIVNEYIDDL